MNDILLNAQENTFFKSKSKLYLCRSNLEYLQQKIRIALSFQKGEWFTDSTIGLPYVPDFDISKTDHRSLLTACIQARVMQIDGIKKMLSFETEYNDTDRTLEVSFIVNTVDGQEIAYTTKLSV